MESEPKADIADVAIASWRLERWLENLVAERKMAAKSSLRLIKKYLEASNIEIIDPIGWKFDPGLSIEVVSNEADDEEESSLIIIETNSPIIKQGGAVIKCGRVVLGIEVKEQKPNYEIQLENCSNNERKDENPNSIDLLDFQENNGLKQGPLVISEGALHWIRAFDLRSMNNRLHPIIRFEFNIGVEVELMDEKVYNNYCKGIKPRSSFVSTIKVDQDVDRRYISPPYQDIWYAIVRPPKGVTCNDFEFNMYCDWLDDDTINKCENKKGNVVENDNQKCTENSSFDKRIESLGNSFYSENIDDFKRIDKISEDGDTQTKMINNGLNKNDGKKETFAKSKNIDDSSPSKKKKRKTKKRRK